MRRRPVALQPARFTQETLRPNNGRRHNADKIRFSVQSMTNTDTADVTSTVNQVMALAQAGSELVRVTVNTDAAAAAIPKIVSTLKQFGVRTPIIGDFHYNGHLLLKKYPACARALAKYRINPGNVNI